MRRLALRRRTRRQSWLPPEATRPRPARLASIASGVTAAALGLALLAAGQHGARAATDPSGTAKVWDIRSAIGFNPDAQVADLTGITGDVATPAHPLTNVTTIDNQFAGPGGPCGLILWNPATNDFEAWGVGGGVTAGVDLNRKGPMMSGPGGQVFQAGDVWVTIEGSPAIWVKPKGSSTLLEYSTHSEDGVRVDESSGMVDLGDFSTGTISQLDPASGLLTDWTVGGEPHYVAPDARGMIYSAVHSAGVAGGADAIVRVDPTTSTFMFWRLPAGGLTTGFSAGETPDGITIDTDGNVWFNESTAGRVGRLDPSTNVISEFSKPSSPMTQPQQIATSGSGTSLQAFLTEAAGDSVTVVDPSVATPTTSVATTGSGTMLGRSVPISFSPIPHTPFRGTIVPTTFTVPGIDPTGITRFTPFPGPPGGTASPELSGMTDVALPNTVFGSEIDGPDSSVFEFSSPTITAPPPPTGTPTPTPRADPPITGHGMTFSATEGQSFSGPVATVTDGDPGDHAAEYGATIDWGDGTTTSGTVTGPDGGPYDVNGSHTYAEEGSDTVKVHVTDSDSTNTADATSTAAVGDAPLSSSCAMPPAIPQSFSGPTAKFTDVASTGRLTDFSATIDWGDGTTTSGTVSGPATGPGPYTVSGSHTYASTGPEMVMTKITDDGGSTTTATCPVLVFAFATSSGGTFDVGNVVPGTAVGTPVTYYWAQWGDVNVLSGGAAPAAFKGFAATPSPSASCGATWTTRTGNSNPPPTTVPAFLATFVSSHITMSGSTISGDIVHIVIIHTDPDYSPDPGQRATGTIVMDLC